MTSACARLQSANETLRTTARLSSWTSPNGSHMQPLIPSLLADLSLLDRGFEQNVFLRPITPAAANSALNSDHYIHRSGFYCFLSASSLAFCKVMVQNTQFLRCAAATRIRPRQSNSFLASQIHYCNRDGGHPPSDLADSIGKALGRL
jgi:hypothetical protein